MGFRWQPGVELQYSNGVVVLDEALAEGEGGEAVVWKLRPPHSSWVAKLFDEAGDREARLKILTPLIKESTGVSEKINIAAPDHLLYWRGEFVGVTNWRFNSVWQPLTYSFQDRSVSFELRLSLATELARAVSFIHSRHFIIGDLSPKNVLCSRPARQVAFIDVDSWGYCLHDTAADLFGAPTLPTPVIAAQMCLREYLPSGFLMNPTQQTDRFALALLIVQLLTAHHPFAYSHKREETRSMEERIARGHSWLVDPPSYALPSRWFTDHHPGVGLLPDGARELVINALFRSQDDPPNAYTWARELRKIDLASCKTCGTRVCIGAQCSACGTARAPVRTVDDKRAPSAHPIPNQARPAQARSDDFEPFEVSGGVPDDIRPDEVQAVGPPEPWDSIPPDRPHDFPMQENDWDTMWIWILVAIVLAMLALWAR